MSRNKSLKALLAGVVLATGVMAYSPQVEAARDFTDLGKSGSHMEAVTYLNSLDAFDYKNGTTLNGSAAVTRVEASVILHSLYSDELGTSRKYNNNFKDINNNTPYAKEMIWSYEVGIFDGDGKGNFKSTDKLTRAQMSKVLVNAFGLTTDKLVSFSDVQTSNWAHPYITIMAGVGITYGTGNGKFSPNNSVTLDQLSSFIYRIINLEDNGVTPEPTPPVVESKPEKPSAPVEGQAELLAKLSPDMQKVVKVAIDLWNRPGYEQEHITVQTNNDVRDEFEEFLQLNFDFSQHVSGYTSQGKGFNISTQSVKGGTYSNRISVYNYRDEEEQAARDSGIAKAEKFIVENYSLNTDYDVVYAINDFTINQFVYGNPSENNPYYQWNDVSNATCWGYTDFMTDLLERFGIKHRSVSGDNHSWNAVHVGGEWYYSDATWTDNVLNGKQWKDDSYILFTQDYRDESISHMDTEFRATNKPFEQSMAKPYDYQTMKKK